MARPVDFGNRPTQRRILTTFLRADRTRVVKARFGIGFKAPDTSDERGSVMVEYTVLLSAVAVGLCLALAALGVPLVKMYLSQQTWLLLPFP